LFSRVCLLLGLHMAVLTACLKLDITMCSNRAFVEAAAAGSKR